MRALALMFVSVCLSGCPFSTTQTRATTLEIIDGCVIRFSGITVTQANAIVKNWNINPKCIVKVSSTVGVRQ